MDWHMCSRNAGGQRTSRLRHLQQGNQTGKGESNTPVPPDEQEKSFCGESQLQLAIPSCLDNITFVGAVINTACRMLSFSTQEATQIEVCVVEAVVNAIKHAYAGLPGYVVEVRVSTQADCLVIQVCDYGQAMTGEMATTLDFDPGDVAQVPEGGMGLFLMHSLMDEVSYESNQGTNVLTMTRRLST